MVNIQPLLNENKIQWQSLWQDYLAFYQTELPQAITDNTWQKIMDENSPIFSFGAWQGDKLIAIAHVALHEHTWTTQQCCYLIDLFVSPSNRGQGFGRAMIEYIYQFANDKNCDRVYWVTKEDNTAARALYDTIASKTDFVQYRKTF